jgi:hypothetical protein
VNKLNPILTRQFGIMKRETTPWPMTSAGGLCLSEPFMKVPPQWLKCCLPAVLLCLFCGGALTHAQDDPSNLSFNILDLCGKWKVEGAGRSGDRTFEFFQDGRATDTSTFQSSSGETTESRKKQWKVSGNKVLITEINPNASGFPTLSIEIPFDPARLQITESFESATSSRSTKMFATRQTPAIPTNPVTPGPKGPLTSSSSPDFLSKLTINVTPLVKPDKEGYMKTERISLQVSLKNPSLRESTGPLTINYWLIGKNLRDPKQFCLLTKGSMPCNLGTDFSSREFKQTTDPYLHKYYYYSSGSYEYDGWIVTISTPSGETVLTKASKSEWERQSSKASSLERGRVYDLRLDPVEGGSVYYY